MQSVGALTRAGWRCRGAGGDGGGSKRGEYRRRREAEAAIDEAWTRLAPPPPPAASLYVNSDCAVFLPSTLATARIVSRQQTRITWHYGTPAT